MDKTTAKHLLCTFLNVQMKIGFTRHALYILSIFISILFDDSQAILILSVGFKYKTGDLLRLVHIM